MEPELTFTQFEKMAEMMRGFCTNEGGYANCCSMMKKMMRQGEGKKKGGEEKMHLSRKTIAVIALVIILAATNVALALLYMTKNVNLTGGVSAVGAIEIYQEDGVTPLTSHDFPLFIGGTAGTTF
jgi:hypothetical protein